MLRDMVDIFEVNRKECARLLLELPKWFTEGTFKPKPGTVANDADQAIYEKSWQIESTVIEVSLVFVNFYCLHFRPFFRQSCQQGY